MCNALVTTNKPTPALCRLDVLPVTQPTVSEHWREKVSHGGGGDGHGGDGHGGHDGHGGVPCPCSWTCSMCSKNMLLFHGLSHYMDDAAGGDNTPSFPWTFSLHGWCSWWWQHSKLSMDFLTTQMMQLVVTTLHAHLGIFQPCLDHSSTFSWLT